MEDTKWIKEAEVAWEGEWDFDTKTIKEKKKMSNLTNNVGEYQLKNKDELQCEEGLNELLSRFLSYQRNALEEEAWAWGAAIAEVNALKKSIVCGGKKKI